MQVVVQAVVFFVLNVFCNNKFLFYPTVQTLTDTAQT